MKKEQEKDSLQQGCQVKMVILNPQKIYFRFEMIITDNTMKVAANTTSSDTGD
jgi:hypothetical protein